MTVDTEIVHERLRLMRELLDDLDGIGPVSTERFDSERVIRHAVERIITQLVDLSVSINSHIVAATKGVVPSTYRESYAAVATVGAIPSDLATELAPSAGLRNVLTHEYVAVDLELVVAAVPVANAAYRRYVAEIARYLLSLPLRRNDSRSDRSRGRAAAGIGRMADPGRARSRSLAGPLTPGSSAPPEGRPVRTSHTVAGVTDRIACRAMVCSMSVRRSSART